MRELERDTPRRAAKQRAHQPITVIGRGRVGGSIARAAERAGVAVVHAGREEAPAAWSEAGLLLLCVPDAEIEPASAALAETGSAPALVGHTSGATGLEALTAARERGAETFSLHPLQTVPTPQTPLTGAPAAIAGSSSGALAAARGLAETIGLDPFEVPEESRAAYHAAASIASNLLIALEQSAVELLDAAGLRDGRELLAPLVLRTAANWSERGAEALTGPIARGDEATVRRHRGALGELAPELLPMYDALADRARALAGTGRDEAAG